MHFAAGKSERLRGDAPHPLALLAAHPAQTAVPPAPAASSAAVSMGPLTPVRSRGLPARPSAKAPANVLVAIGRDQERDKEGTK